MSDDMDEEIDFSTSDVRRNPHAEKLNRENPMNKKIEKKIKAALTVGDLKKALADFPDDMPVGSGGHFGEFKLFSKFDLPSKSNGYVTASFSWRDDNREYIDVLELPYYDHGPEPD